ncbi:LLM class flavin-dependent oxidoreductase [Microbacterium sp.]|uniref:LLM class flavin-dependent oxidoreductase n=1 Tax=Microbacterium sp. TaxID=51671 RepID=UPI002FE18612
MTEPLIIGAMVRTLGAYPSGWRQEGAHRDPAGDAEILRRVAQAGEDADLDYLFFGDWLATGPDLEFRDPYLLARIDPVSAVLFLAGITSRIGLIATVNATYADPYTTARSLASLDVLTHGRAGINLVTGAEPRAAGNHGRDAHADNVSRYDRAEEFVTALRRLWDSWSEDAWIADAARGVLIDPDGLRAADLRGAHLSVTGPLNVARPPQGQIPIVHAGTSPRSRALAATEADLALIAAPVLVDAIEVRRTLRGLAADAGRDPDGLKVIAPVLPVVADTDADAHRIVERLLALVPLAEGHQSARTAFPANRTVAALADALAVDPDDALRHAAFDSPVTEAEHEGSAAEAPHSSSAWPASPDSGSRIVRDRGIRSPGGISSQRTPFPPRSWSAMRRPSPTTSRPGAIRAPQTGSMCSRHSSQRSSRRSRRSPSRSSVAAACSDVTARRSASGSASPRPPRNPRSRPPDQTSRDAA